MSVVYSLFCSLVEFGPVWNGARHTSDMNIVKVIVRVCPWMLVDVVDLEAHIWRDEARLDRGNIYSSHLGRWVFIRKVTK